MSASKNIVLITGGNAGIGFELASQFLADPSKHILLGSRSSDKGEAAVKELQSLNLPGTVELVLVDVNSEESIKAAAKEVEAKHGRLDALVNNAAAIPFTDPIAQGMAKCFQTNTIGPVLMVEAFTPLLKKSSGTPRIVNVSTSQGSMTRRADPTFEGYTHKSIVYRASKAALNMVTVDQDVLLGEDGFKVFAYCPGFTVSTLSPHNNAENGAKPTSEGAAPIVKIVNGERDAEHGKLLHGAGQHPW